MRSSTEDLSLRKKTCSFKLINFDTLLQPQLKVDVISLVVANGFGKNILTTIEIIISIVGATPTY